MTWHTIDTAPEDVVVETKIDDAYGCRNVQKLVRKKRLWFLPDMSMYVYYEPTHWAHTPRSNQPMANDSILTRAEVEHGHCCQGSNDCKQYNAALNTITQAVELLERATPFLGGWNGYEKIRDDIEAFLARYHAGEKEIRK